MNPRPRHVGAFVVLAVALAACAGPGERSASTASTSGVATTTDVTTVTTTASPIPTTGATTTTAPIDACADPDAGLVVELDGVAPEERVVVVADGNGAEIAVCDGLTYVAGARFEDPEARVLGAVDLDNAAPLEIVLATQTSSGPAVRIARSTLRGIEVTDVLAERWIDAPFDGETLFHATSFECADVDDDGARELLVVRYRPADTPGFEGGEGLINISIAVLVADGVGIETAGIDQFEEHLLRAHARFIDDPRCGPDSPGRVDFRYAANGWGMVDAADAFAGRGDSLMTAIAVDPVSGTYVAVGAESPSLLLGEFFQAVPAIWWSTDRLTWNRVDLGEAIGELRDVAALDQGGFVAVGRDPAGATAWFSREGKEWERASVPVGAEDSPGIFGHLISAVVATPLGIIAGGTESYAGDRGAPGEDLDPALWLSADGASWQRIDHPAFGTPGFQLNESAEFNGEILDVAFAPGIGIVAAGSASAPDPTIDYPTQYPTVWVSVDGVDWQRHRLDLDGRLRGIVTQDGATAVVGLTDVHGSPTSDAVVMVSLDGVSWTRAEGPFSGFSDPDGIQSINGGLVVPGIGVVVFGSDQAEADTRGGAAVWWSRDELETWERVPHDRSVFGLIDAAPTYTMTGGVWDGSVLTVVGFTGRAISLPGGGTGCCVLEPAIWMWDPGRVQG